MSDYVLGSRITLADRMSSTMRTVISTLTRTQSTAQRLNNTVQSTGGTMVTASNRASTSMNRMSGSADRMASSTRQVGGAATSAEPRIVRLGNETNRAGQQAEQASRSFDTLRARINATMGNIEKSSGAISSIGMGVSAFGGAVAGGLGVAAHTAIKFDDSMSKVRALSGAVGDDFQSLRDKALELGGSTAHSSSAVAEAFSYQALAGWKTNEILAATPGLLNLASAAQLDLATASDITTDTMSAFGMSADQAGVAADMLATVQSNANTDVRQLGEAMKYASAAANAAGMDLAQTSAVLGVLADSSIKGSSGGTTMVSMLSDMKNKAKDGAIAIGQTSVAVYDAHGNMRDLGTIMKDVGKATEGMTTAQKDAALGAVWGIEAMKGVNIMLATGSERYEELENQIYNSSGAAAEIAEIMEDNTAGALRSLSSAMESASVAIGDNLTPAIRFGAEWITRLVSSFNNLPKPVTQAITIVTVLVAALALAAGPILLLIAMLPSITSGFALIAGTLGVTVAGFLKFAAIASGVIAAVVAIGVVFYKLWSQSHVLRAVLADVFSKIKDSLISAFEPIKNSIAMLKGSWDYLINTFSGSESLFTNVWQTLGDKAGIIIAIVAEKLLPYLTSAFQVAADAIIVAIGFVRDIFGKIASWWQADGAMVIQAVQNVVGFIVGVFRTISPVLGFVFNIVKVIVLGVWENIKNVISSGIGIIMNVVNIFSAIFTGNWGALWENVKGLVSNGLTFIWNLVQLTFLGRMLGPIRAGMTFIRTILTTAWQFIRSLFSGSLSGVSNLVRTNFNIISTVIQVAMSAIRTGISVAWTFIKGIFQAGTQILRGNWSGAWSTIRTTVSTAWDIIKQLIGTAIDAVKTRLSTGMDTVKTTIKTKWEEIISYAKGLPEKFTTFGKNIIEGLWNGIKNAAAGLGEKVSSLIDSVVPGPVQSLLGIASPSKLFKRFGRWTMEGLGIGIDSGADNVLDKTKNVANQMANVPFTTDYKANATYEVGKIPSMPSIPDMAKETSLLMNNQMTSEIIANNSVLDRVIRAMGTFADQLKSFTLVGLNDKETLNKPSFVAKNEKGISSISNQKKESRTIQNTFKLEITASAMQEIGSNQDTFEEYAYKLLNFIVSKLEEIDSNTTSVDRGGLLE